MAKSKNRQRKTYPLIVNQVTAAELLGVSSITVWRWWREGRINRLPQFKSARYSMAELQRITSQIEQEAA
ncbi:MAG: hypothetical protein U5L02_06220 [Rheinheimera sp.]|nr:hypothetical protein [Rheinheimera sp.]